MNKVLLLLLIIILILCFKNINKIVKKSEQNTIKFIIIVIIIGLVFMCKDKLIEGIENLKDECKNVDSCTGEGDPKYLCLDINAEPPVCNTNNGKQCKGSNMLWCIEDGEPASEPSSETAAETATETATETAAETATDSAAESSSGEPVIKIKNSTGGKMFVFLVSIDGGGDDKFNKDGKLPTGWTVVDNKKNTKANNTYYYTVEPNTNLGFTTNNIIKNKWMSATMCVTKTLPSDINKFDYRGLTKYEWTFDSTNLNINISGADGLNSFGELTIIGGNRSGPAPCPPGDENTTKIKCKHNKRIDTDIFKTILNDDINRYTRDNMKKNPENTQLQKTIIQKGFQCGNAGDCDGCATPADRCLSAPCYKKGCDQDTGCVLENIKDRWGCYNYWATSPDAINWRKLFDNEHGCPVYAWAYDENVMINPENAEKLDDINCPMNESCQDWSDSNLYKCLLNEDGCQKDNEVTYLEDNPNKPLRVCKLNSTIRVEFDIVEII
jgi:hypothetical protein